MYVLKLLQTFAVLLLPIFFLFNQIKVIIQGNISEKMKIKSLFKQNMQGGGDGLGENYHLYFYLKVIPLK